MVCVTSPLGCFYCKQIEHVTNHQSTKSLKIKYMETSLLKNIHTHRTCFMISEPFYNGDKKYVDRLNPDALFFFNIIQRHTDLQLKVRHLQIGESAFLRVSNLVLIVSFRLFTFEFIHFS